MSLIMSLEALMEPTAVQLSMELGIMSIRQQQFLLDVSLPLLSNFLTVFSAIVFPFNRQM